MFVEYCHTAFPGSDIDFENLFGLAGDRVVFSAALALKGLHPVTRDTMTTAFLYLRQFSESVEDLLP
jgi:hypothetical protein